MWFFYARPTAPEQSHGNDSRGGSGIRQDRSLVVDESAPLVRDSSTSHACPWPCRVSAVCLALCVMWIAGVAAILLLWFVPAPAEGTRAREWRDDPAAVIGFVVSVVSFVSVCNVLCYFVMRRRQVVYVEVN
ncbi:hypothetical protein MTO96_040797 [Rhipicephalus appendiculatus]